VVTLEAMHAPGQAERVWIRRLRWRMRGAWQWPAFAVLTVVDAVLLVELPFYEDGPGSLVGGMLLAAFFNLLVVAVIGPLLGLWLRRRRPDLPRPVAADSASTAVMALICAGFLVGGLLHRPAVAAGRQEVATVAATTRAYVIRRAPEYRPGLASIDAMRVEEDLYRSCVPGPDPRRWLCLFVSTDQHPPGIAEDPDRAPNSAYRMHGGFR
jgi:hypothetical protein